MTRTKEDQKELAFAVYWDGRYTVSDGEQPTHEWFKNYSALQPFLTKVIFQDRAPEKNPRILHLGSGDSTVPYDLHKVGYKNQVCIDFSPVVVSLMGARMIPGIDWILGDVRDMQEIPTHSVDVAFDKGTMDAMIYGSPWSPPDDVKENARLYVREVSRVLADDGVFIWITFRQPIHVKPLLIQEDLWSVEVETLQENQYSFEYYAFILRKSKTS
ncbi:uncharacterized protein K489DRAFT_326276 [Dissoconium aciculare CBS 342.82]|uniref:Methyltransferase domain-containing protein n=1 Tax=Dissoconium aciculare CBS 342.82 TaxID=1314786 RepID=A0A6J3LU10_9PEZI|nr:uncharacterized protein K489DRAFT_326276 [Dissoconium aciculare CBS 342.82]KAF1819275.1 hypothetical protein K489DRAFT_326276 [Dissoconium aciculare CBS 342.82]